jgi:KaiC/GvpD/RAD55 family RecA-like ATPase
MEFINPLSDEIAAGAVSGKTLATAILSALESSLGIRLMAERKMTSSSSSSVQDRYNVSNNTDGITSKPIRAVIDSMSHTSLLLGERMLIEFVMDLSSILKKLNVTAILTLTTSSTDQGTIW